MKLYKNGYRFTWHITYWLNIKGHQITLKAICLADCALLLRIVYPANITLEDTYDYNIDDNSLQPENIDMQDTIIMELSNGIIIKRITSLRIQKYVRTTDTDEYAFYDPDRPEEHRHHDNVSDVEITAKYDTAVDFSGFTMNDDDCNK